MTQLWIFNYDTGLFIPKEITSNRISIILFNSTQATSNADANRLIKGNAVSIRRANSEEDWIKVKDFKQELPSGWPYYLRVGSGLGRLIQDPDSNTTKFIQLYGIRTVMIPTVKIEEFTCLEKSQSISVWSEIWSE